MKRDLARLADNEYDLLVIGGGIYGVCVAWDAVLRGLSVALVDKGDFGHATSANSLKIIHGGLRYLQDANFKLIRTMIRERMIWMRIAPHLVHPLPCLIPTDKKLTRNKAMMATALAINDLLGFDRNRLIDPQKYLPNGRLTSKDESLQSLPGLAADGITGGAVWYDAQIYNSERLLLSFVLSAAEAGAVVANYVEATGFLRHDRDIKGIKARDKLTDQDFDIRAKVVVNCAGAWVDSLLTQLPGLPPAPKFHLSTAMNLVTRQILPKYAVGIPSNHLGKDGTGKRPPRSQMLFIVPWRRYSLIGTRHAPYAGAPQDYQVAEEVIQDFIDEVNTAYPGAALAREDVYHVHWGFLPTVADEAQALPVKLVRQGQVHDHEQEDGLAGLITIVGVKYTTARYVAQMGVDLVVKKLNRKVPASETPKTPVYGGQINRFDDFLTQAIRQRPFGLAPEILKHLVYTYGSAYCQVLKYLDKNPAWGQIITVGSPVLKAEVIHAVREEMAQKLTDIIQRRTELGAAGLPNEACLQVCAELMAVELGWDQGRREREINEARAAYTDPTLPVREASRVLAPHRL